MQTLAGMTPTGRRIAGPASDLVELQSTKGLKHTGILFHEEYRDHEALNQDLHEILGFLEKPGVPGLLELVDIDPDTGAFIYPTGTVWSVAEIVRSLADVGKVGGVKAGLELCYLASQILTEAGEKGASTGVYSHGALSPWRLILRHDGQVQILGYGVPQVEIVVFREDESRLPREDSFRYCPPERFEGKPEDVSTDIFSVALIAFELMTGRPVYDGLVNDIRHQASRAEGARRLYQLRDQLPEGVREVLGRALKFDPDTRFPNGADFVYAVHDLLASPDAEGPSLLELVTKVRAGKRGSQPLLGGQTGALSRAQLEALREELDDPDPKPLPPPRMARPEAEPEVKPEPEAPRRWERVQRRGAEEAEPAPRRVEEGPRRLRRSEDEEGPRRIRSEEGPRRLRTRDEAPRRIRADEDPARRVEESPRRLDEGPRRIRSEEGPRRTRAEDPRAAMTSSGGTEALLARMRASSDDAPAPTPAARAPSPPPVAAATPVAEPPRVAPPSLPPAPPATEPAARRAARGSDELVYVQVSLDGGPAHRTRLRQSEPLAETANRLVQALGAPPTDLLGSSTGWYRIAQDGRRWRGDETVGVLDPDRPVELAFVPNRIVRVDFEVEGLGEPIRFQAPVGTAVPVRSLLAHLRRWLNLPDAAWGMWVDGVSVGSMQILDEFDPREGFLVVVRR